MSTYRRTIRDLITTHTYTHTHIQTHTHIYETCLLLSSWMLKFELRHYIMEVYWFNYLQDTVSRLEHCNVAIVFSVNKMVCKLTYPSEFGSHWVLLSHGLVHHLSKKLSELPQLSLIIRGIYNNTFKLKCILCTISNNMRLFRGNAFLVSDGELNIFRQFKL